MPIIIDGVEQDSINLTDLDFLDPRGFLHKTGLGAYETLQTNLSAEVAPDVTDDSDAGYSIGSVWLDTVADKIYQATDVTPGAALWKDLTSSVLIHAADATIHVNATSVQQAISEATGPFDLAAQDLTNVGAVNSRVVEADGVILDAHVADANIHVNATSVQTAISEALGAFDFANQDITDAGAINGRTVETDGATLDAHVADANIHVSNVSVQQAMADADAPFNFGGQDLIDAGTINTRNIETDGTKLDGIEAGATADQSDAEIETAYNNQVAIVGQAEAEAGVATTRRGWTAERVAQAIAALGGGGGGGGGGLAFTTDSGGTLLDKLAAYLAPTNDSAFTFRDRTGFMQFLTAVGTAQVTVSNPPPFSQWSMNMSAGNHRLEVPAAVSTGNAVWPPRDGTPFTIVSWSRPSAVDNRGIMGRYYSGGRMFIHGFSSGSFKAWSRLGDSSGGSGTEAFSVAAVTVNTWSMMASVYKPGVTVGVSLNGATLVTTAHSWGTLQDSAKKLVFGDYNDLTGSTYFIGQLGLVMCWNRALTQTEIDDLYNAGVGSVVPLWTPGCTL